MISIILSSHGTLAEALLDTASSIVGDIPNMKVIHFPPEATPDQLHSEFDHALSLISPSDQILFIVDLPNGTPFQVAASYLHNDDQACITGMNLPMIIEAAILRNKMELDDLVERISDTAQKSIMTVHFDLSSMPIVDKLEGNSID